MKHHVVSKLGRSATWTWHWRKVDVVFYLFNIQRKEISCAFFSWKRERDAIGYSRRTKNIPYTWNIHNQCLSEFLVLCIELYIPYLFPCLSNVWQNFLIKINFILKSKLELHLHYSSFLFVQFVPKFTHNTMSLISPFWKPILEAKLKNSVGSTALSSLSNCNDI